MRETSVYNLKQGDWKPHPTSPGVFVQPILSGDEGLGFKNMYVKIVPGGEILPHTHDTAEVFCFIKGLGSVLVNGERKDCGEGTVVVAPAGVEHGVKNNTGEDIYLLANFKS
ncbi:quercetin dioxygenase-like cupin family protein [Desulfohalotomaculum tongense]|uniref:cupin domain-containing protein n=1 Tax=Desulforadius tongensis TaxID=1216062 RepID=UPI00195AD80A|nr:cupin domain-containing protein [Desulforadius tongensis]MBM7854852.1 quercetin dioxygenase-like cupin family protein [Desulforadius tongensis]